jgi:hypothetical protein
MNWLKASKSASIALYVNFHSNYPIALQATILMQKVVLLVVRLRKRRQRVTQRKATATKTSCSVKAWFEYLGFQPH